MMPCFKSILRKSLLLAAIYYTLVLAGSCCHCETVTQAGKFQFTGIGVSNQSFDFNFRDVELTHLPSAADTFKHGTYGIGIRFDHELTAGKKKQLYTTFCTPAMATSCECPTPYYKAKDTIQAINIVTVYDFDTLHKAGSDLTEYFTSVSVHNTKEGGEFQYKPVHATISDMMEITDAGANIEQAYFLRNRPDNSTMIQLDIRVRCTNGKTYQQLTRPVFLYKT